MRRPYKMRVAGISFTKITKISLSLTVDVFRGLPSHQTGEIPIYLESWPISLDLRNTVEVLACGLFMSSSSKPTAYTKECPISC